MIDQVMTANTPRVAITGASGYLGSRLCHYFKEANACVSQLTSSPQNADASLPVSPFSLGEGTAKEFFAENQIHALIHAAYDFRPKSRKDIRDTNVKGSIALFKQAREEGVARIIFISTMSAYEGCRSLYGQAKLEIESALREMGMGLALRPGLIYSTPLEESGGMVGSICKQVKRGRLVPLIGGGSQTLFLTHENDLARFIDMLISQRDEEWQKLQLERGYVTTANPQPYTLRKIVELIAAAQGQKQMRFVPIPWRPVWLALKSLETLGINASFRSDSVLSLAYQQKQLDLSSFPREFSFRDFREALGV